MNIVFRLGIFWVDRGMLVVVFVRYEIMLFCCFVFVINIGLFVCKLFKIDN